MGSIHMCCILAVRLSTTVLIPKQSLFLQEMPRNFSVDNSAKRLQLCFDGVACRKRMLNGDSIYHKWHASDVL